MSLFIICLTAVIGLYMAWNIGANDVANSMADAVGSKALSIKQAVILAGICEFAGAVLVGSHVTETVRKGIVDPALIANLPGLREGEAAAILVIGMAAALLCAAIWLNVATVIGMPVSTTHSIVGAVAGFGIIAAGVESVDWTKMGQIVASWFISPIIGGVCAFLLFKFISRRILGRSRPARAAIIYTPAIVFLLVFVVAMATIYKGLKHVIGNITWLTDDMTLVVAVVLAVVSAVLSRYYVKAKLQGKQDLSISKQLEAVESVFVPLVIISSCSVAFAHGANDVANAVGPFAAIVHILQTGDVSMQVGVPTWILGLGGIGIVLGLATYGHKVMTTVGTKITEITPSRGVAADIAATTTVLICTRMALPVSTTHTLVGAIMGIGLARGLGGIDRDVTRNIFGSWFVTVPIAAILSIVLFIIGRALFLDIMIKVVTG
ncbi:MAG: anion permease [Desulfurivibrionaceae bacterium]|nr:anion permease [Desulfurivibrionaceae bacterium]